MSDTKNIIVHVFALPGYRHYKPVVAVNGISVPNMAITPDKPQFNGSVGITLGAGSVFKTTDPHEDGAYSYSTVTYTETPEVVSAVFTGGYPGSQTEVKENDTFNLRVISDKPMVGIYVYDYEAAKVSTFTFASITDKTVTLIIANRGTTAVLRPVKIKLRDTYGSYGSDYITSVAGSVDGVNVVRCDNLYPSVSFGAVSYPGSQQALKDAESATVSNTVSNFNTISYVSSNGDLSVTSPSIYEASKNVSRIGGSYNVVTNNITITATRTANNAVTSGSSLVKIAHTAHTISVGLPAARLRSGGNFGTSPQDHIITLTASQQLLEAPSMVAPEGTWQGAGFSGAGTIWTRSLRVSDSNVKGTYAFNTLSSTNLAGKVVSTFTGSANYTLGGFVFRTLTVPAWPNRETAIGTQVADTSKLRCTNLSKGLSGSLNYTFQASIVDTLNYYTITQPTGVYNAVGKLWYNCDLPNSLSNTTGTMQIELEELP